jgi:hypothetical protein
MGCPFRRTENVVLIENIDCDNFDQSTDAFVTFTHPPATVGEGRRVLPLPLRLLTG